MGLKQGFFTKQGAEFPGVSPEETLRIRDELHNQFHISDVHIAEAASYSMAMVVRVALGLSAEQSHITVIANNSLSGKVALATLRHLSNAGTNGELFILESPQNVCDYISEELKILKAMGVDHRTSNSGQSLAPEINSAISSSHNVVCGLFELSSSRYQTDAAVIDILNESKTPVHCIDAPPGVDVLSGKALVNPLFASSTLSLGTPYCGLYTGESYVGRHYLCDISLPKALYKSCGYDLTPLFSEQPVVQIFPIQHEVI